MKQLKTLLLLTFGLAIHFATIGQNETFQVDGVHIQNLSAYTTPFTNDPYNLSFSNRSLRMELWTDDDPELYLVNSWSANLVINLRIGSSENINSITLTQSQNITTGQIKNYDVALLEMGGKVSSIAITSVSFASSQSVSSTVLNQNELASHMHVRFTWVYDQAWDATLNQIYGPSNISEIHDPTNKVLTLNWGERAGAKGYDVEWLFLSDGNEDPNTHENEAMPYDFKNAVRLHVEKGPLDIRLAYPKGTLIYRIRAVGEKSNGDPDPGKWSYEPNITTIQQAHDDDNNSTTPILCCLYINETDQLEKFKNWQYSATFIENGKKKEVINFADGSLRNRQAVTLMGGNALVGETKYDLDGRPAMNVLPSPVAYNGLRYYTNSQGASANGSNVNGIFYKDDFFSDDRLNRGGVEPPALPSSASLSSQYYSPNNSLSFENKAAVPDANGWVYSQTKFLNDGTDRPIEQSGVGEAFKPNGDYTTRYYYAKPTQTELDRLFGNEAGKEAYYQKNMVVDANGQVSVSYLDNKGRVIATALAGHSPKQLDSLNLWFEPISARLFEGQKQPNSEGVIRSSYTMTVSSPNTEATIDYSLSAADMFGCHDESPCKYDMTVIIYDQKGNQLEKWDYPSITSLDHEMMTYNFQDIGSYTITREVKLTSQELENFVSDEEAFLIADVNMVDNSCVPYYLSPDIICPGEDCLSQCEFVYKVVNAGETLYLDNLGNQYRLMPNGTQYQNVLTNVLFNVSPTDPVSSAIAACETACEVANSLPIDLNPCDLQLKKLLFDFSPGGQFFDNHAGHYQLNEDGTVRLTENGSVFDITDWGPEYNPDGWMELFIPNYIDLINSANGTSYSTRQKLIDNWEPAYAQALLPYHPEYCAYEFFCLGLGGTCDDPGFEDIDQNMIYDYLNIMYADGDDMHATGQGSYPHSYDLFNPLGFALNSTLNAPTDDYSNYVHLDNLVFPGYPGGNPDPITLCPISGTLGYHINTFIAEKLQHFIPTNIIPNEYYSIWFVLDDPFDFKTNAAPDPTLDQLFKAIHGGGPNPGVLTHMTKYEFFRSVYAFYRDWAIYDYFDNMYTCSVPMGFSESADPSGFYILWDYDDPSFPGGSTPLLAIDAILSPSNNNSLIPDNIQALIGTKLTFPRKPMYDLAASGSHDISALVAGTQFDPASSTLAGIDNEAMKCECENILEAAATFFYIPLNALYVLTDSQLKAYFQSLSPSISFSNSEMVELLKCNAQIPDYTFLINDPRIPESFSCSPTFGPGLTCEQIQLQRNLDNAKANYLVDLDYYIHNLKGALNATCLSDYETRETVTITYSLKEYHYTLYYYDQAGNLVKTVPPKGVDVIYDLGKLDAVAMHRYNKYTTPFIVPNHKMATRYIYNSLNQLVEQTTPDGGTSQFWYDTEGRLVVSQNAEQAISREPEYRIGCSYTLYDNLSRIVEVGELNTTAPTLVESGNFLSAAQTWITSNPSNRKDVVRTYYDALPSAWPSPPSFGLDPGTSRNRVVASLTYDDFNSLFDGYANSDYQLYNHATYYQYDIHGNVKELEQDYRTMPDPKKSIKYEYDLLSGNVKHVIYQEGFDEDEFHHRYAYDADNRIQKVETSKDGVTWTEDANYIYYPHGPLSRTELGGQLKVSGTDYAYTLQGWLKYINGGSMGNAGGDGYYDIGTDGKTGSINADFLPSAFSYTLGYYSTNGGDFKSIDNTNNGFEILISTVAINNAAFSQTNRSLYNGNISYTVSGLPTSANNDKHILNLYHYDQLNRITDYQSYNDVGNLHSNLLAGFTASNKGYRSNYTYDANGNIKTLKRSGKTNIEFDDLTYHYDDMTAATPSNKLWYVDDAKGVATIGDIADQGPNYYNYDAVGNLIKEGNFIHDPNDPQIEWTVSGKVKSYSNSTTGEDILFTYDASGNRIGKEVTGGASDHHYRYVRDASGNVMAVYDLVAQTNGKVAEEHMIYGSSRLGKITDLADLLPAASQTVGNNRTLHHSFRLLGNKEFELSNHLGNVMVTLKDERLVNNTTSTALTLNEGNQEYVALPQGYTNQSLQNVTLTAWVRTDVSGGSYNSNWALIDFDNANYYSFYVRGDNGKVGFSFCNNQGSSTAVRDLNSNTPVNDGQWHHIAVVFGDITNPSNYTDVKFYIDGQLDNHSYNSSWGSTIGKPNTTRYGFMGDGSKATSPYNHPMRYKEYYHGSLDELAYWHRALSAAEIQQAYSNNIAGISATNLQAWYSFDAQTTSAITDYSGNNRHGTAYKNGNTATPQQFNPTTTQRITASTAMASVTSYSDYYPFGMTMPGRQYNAGDYRYGFNGMLIDNEISGTGNSYTAEFWQYDSRLGRRWNVDPVDKPWLSSYTCFSSNPILRIDPNGDDDIFDSKGNFLYSTKKGNQILFKLVTDKGTSFIPLGKVSFQTIRIKKEDGTIVNVGTQASNLIITKVANHYGGTGANYSILKDPNSNSFAETTPGKKDTEFVVDDKGKLSPLSSDINNFSSVVFHEKLHSATKDKSASLGYQGMIDHLSIYMQEFEGDAFLGTTKDYKELMIGHSQNMVDLLKNTNNENYIKKATEFQKQLNTYKKEYSVETK